MDYVIGADLGTTAIKVGLFDAKGKCICLSTNEYILITPEPYIVEQDVEVYWESFSDGIREILQQSGIDPRSIVALAISAQSETLVFLDAQGRPIGNAIVWMDNRARKEADELTASISADDVYHVTGQPEILGTLPAAKVLWMRRHMPEVFAQTAMVMQIEDYFIYRLCGKFVSEASVWSTSAMIDIVKQDFWPEMLSALSLDRKQLPVLQDSATFVSVLSPSVAEDLGLDRSLKVIMGGQDQACGAIGVGNVREGTLSESTGAALATCMMCDEPLFDERNRLPVYRSCIPGKYMISMYGSGGIAHRWVRDALCQEEKRAAALDGTGVYDKMNILAESVPAGSDGLVVLPHFFGATAPDADQYAKCTVYGLDLHHGKAHLIRGFMEGVAVVLCRMVETCKEQGLHISQIRSLSGGAKSDLWCQIKADVTGTPVVVMQNVDNAACFGAALLAGVGAGIWSDVECAAEEAVKVRKVFSPREENRMIYDDLVRKYKLLMQDLSRISSRL